MTTDIHAQVSGWVADEVGKQAFGEDFGFAVSWGAAQAATPSGPVAIPVWNLLLIARNPILGEGPLYHMIPIGDPAAMHLSMRPTEATVREKVTEGLRLLRELAASKLSGRNGGAPAPLARGSG